MNLEAVREFFFGAGPIAWLQHTIGLWHPLPFRAFSLLGDTWGMLLVLGLALWLFGRRVLYAEVVMVALAALVQFGLSNLFRVPRPSGEQIHVFRHLQVGSLPSGHVMQTVGAWGLLFALGCIPLWLAVLATLLVTLGRLYLGMHFVADVVSAWALGALLVWGFRRLWPALWGWLQQRSFRSWLAVAAVLLIAGVARLSVMGGVPRRYEVMGMVVGSAIALPVEARFIAYRPPRDGWARAGTAVVGFLGILSLLLLDRSAPESARLLGFFTAGGTTLWIFLVAPRLGMMAAHRMNANDTSETLRRSG